MADGVAGTRERRDLITRLITRVEGLGGKGGNIKHVLELLKPLNYA